VEKFPPLFVLLGVLDFSYHLIGPTTGRCNSNNFLITRNLNRSSRFKIRLNGIPLFTSTLDFGTNSFLGSRLCTTVVALHHKVLFLSKESRFDKDLSVHAVEQELVDESYLCAALLSLVFFSDIFSAKKLPRNNLVCFQRLRQTRKITLINSGRFPLCVPTLS